MAAAGAVAAAVAVVGAALGCRFDAGGSEPAERWDGPFPPPWVDAPRLPDGVPPPPWIDAPRTPDAARPRPDAPEEPGLAISTSLGGRAIDIDAQLDDWSGAVWHTYPLGPPSHVDEWHSSWSPSGTARFASVWSPTELYFAFRIEDDRLRADSEAPYDDDSIDLYLDMDGDRAGPYETTAAEHDHAIFVAYDETWSTETGSLAELHRAASGTAGGFIVEVRLPVADLGGPGLQAGRTIGFGTGVNDDDGFGPADTDGFVAWYFAASTVCSSCCDGEGGDHTEPWCDTGRIGRLRLEP